MSEKILHNCGSVQYVLPITIFVAWLIWVGLRFYVFVRVRRSLKPALSEAELLPWPNNRLATMSIWWGWFRSLRHILKVKQNGGQNMSEPDDINLENDVSPSVFGKPLGFLQPKTPIARAAQRARRRGDTCPAPEELKRAQGALHGHAAVRSGDEEWDPPVTMI